MHATGIPTEVAVMADRHTGIVSRHSAMWDGVAADLIVKGPAGAHEVIVEPTVDTVFLTRTNDPHPVIKRLGAAPEQAIIHPGRLMNFVAAGDRLKTVVPRGNKGMDRLAIAITPHAVERLDLGCDLKFERLSALNVERPLVRAVVDALANELVSPGIHGHIYAEMLTGVLILELLRAQEAHPEHVGAGALAPRQLHRVMSYIRENLDNDISLHDLADLTALSKSQFGRAFKASTGMTPYRWLVSARIRRSQQLLRDGRLSLAEIALATGFSEQSHFTRTFHRIVGASPGAWQRDRRK